MKERPDSEFELRPSDNGRPANPAGVCWAGGWWLRAFARRVLGGGLVVTRIRACWHFEPGPRNPDAARAWDRTSALDTLAHARPALLPPRGRERERKIEGLRQVRCVYSADAAAMRDY